MPNPIHAVNIRRAAYAMATTDGQSAEITMYGDIYDQRPTDWRGDPIEGKFITLDEFMKDLEQLAGCNDITIRINSYGGDAGASNTIHNRLRELSRAGAHLTCLVDGVAMSGGSLIMCACDAVKVNPSSLIMIHKCWGFLWGGYNADELREEAASYDAWDKAQVAIYKRKTGLSETVIFHMMEDTTYMTGREAVDKGFADEIMEDAEPLEIAASADGRSLYMRGRALHLTPGMFAPDTIPTVNPEASAPDKTNTIQPAITGNEGGKTMAKNLEELRAENPELAEALLTEAKAAVSASGAGGIAPVPPSGADAVTAAIQAEQKRIQEIDAVAGLYDAETVKAAKYGENACTAQEMTYRAAQKAAQEGKNYLGALEGDTQASGAQAVGSVPTGGETPPTAEMAPEQRMAAARAEVQALFGKKKED